MPEIIRPVITPPQLLDIRRAQGTTTGHLEDRAAGQSWNVGLEEVAGDGMTFRGYAALFNSQSEDLGGFREVVTPTAFDKTLAERRTAIKMFWNHDQNRPLGSTKAIQGRGQLALRTDPKGMVSEVRLPDTNDGRDMAELVRTGIVDSMSFGFTAIRDAWQGDSQRELLEVRVWEVSPVTGWPAYQGTTASVRSLANRIGAPAHDLELATRALVDGAELTPAQVELLELALRQRTTRETAADVALYRARFASL